MTIDNSEKLKIANEIFFSRDGKKSRKNHFINPDRHIAILIKEKSDLIPIFELIKTQTFKNVFGQSNEEVVTTLKKKFENINSYRYRIKDIMSCLEILEEKHAEDITIKFMPDNSGEYALLSLETDLGNIFLTPLFNFVDDDEMKI